MLALGLPSLLRGEEVTVFAAASLTDALQEIGRSYEVSTGDKVVFNLGASNDLARQIQAGAPADVFFSAEEAKMDALEKATLVRRAERVNVLSNVLAVVVPADIASPVRTPADLSSLKRIAIADPDAAPAGAYARRYLQSVGLWERLKDRIVPALNARAALSAVESGHADAWIVYRTDAALSRRVRVAFEVPREQGPPIVYVLAPLVASRKPAARKLVRYLAAPEAAGIYQRLGFLVPADR